jgi:diguanylate cyclase (GGDEF)-like protein
MTVRDYALARLQNEMPGIVLAIAAITCVVNILDWVAVGIGPTFLVDNAVVAVLLLTALATSRRWIPAAGLPWLASGVACLLVALYLIQIVTFGVTVNMYYLIIVCAVYPSLTLFWRPYIVSAIVIATATTTVAVRTAPQPDEWVIPMLAALAAGGVLLRFRLRSIEATVRATTLLSRQATTDALTGLLNRAGFEQQARAVVEAALETGQPVFAAFFDVDGLKRVNDRWGHEAGDAALRVAARAVREALRDGDVLARWGGDEFVAVGLGECPDVDALGQRVDSIVRRESDRHTWPYGVSVGVAVGGDSFEGLIEQADRHMYERRRRATPDAGPPGT